MNKNYTQDVLDMIEYQKKHKQENTKDNDSVGSPIKEWVKMLTNVDLKVDKND